MFADISGFTKLSEQLAELGKAGAEELTVLLNATFEGLLSVARDEGGDLVKFGGDALFLFFEGDDHAARACRAAHGMRAALKARGPVVTGRGRVVLRISMGAHSGPFLFVLAGDQQRELFVLGEHATTVTDMEATAEAGEILVSRATAALLPPRWRGAAKGDGILLRTVEPGPTSVGGEPEPTTSAGADADLDLDRLVPAAIRRRVEAGEHEAEHRRTTVSFVHVGGIDDEVRSSGPAAVAERLHRIVVGAAEAADRHGVTLLATDVAGGGVKLILTAGVPDAVEDGEGRMLAVGRALLDADFGLPVRVGVNTGHVFAGEVGAPWRRVYTVIGDAVNLSARFMAKASHGQLVANRVSVDQSATRFVTTELEPFMVKGKRHPQHAYAVGDRIEGRGRNAAMVGRFVGREDELRRLHGALDGARGGEGSCIEIVGEAGLGKSRLVQELLDAAADTRVVRLTCEPFAADRPYFMARLLLRAGIGIAFDASSADAGDALLRWLDDHMPDARPWSPLLAIAVDAEVPGTREVDDLGADFRAARLREVASGVLRAAYAESLLLVVEDAMWMDEASAHVIATALQSVAGASWFACCTTRDRATGLSGRLGYPSDVMTLEALDDSWAADLAADLTEDASISHDELLELCARAKGNPLFLVELAHARRELGSLDAIPGSLEDLIAARIDRLAPSDRNLLRHAAVLGDRFAPRLFDRTLGDAFTQPVPWQRLGDFIITDQGELRFAHDMVRRVAYAGLPFRRRRELHRRIGMALMPRGEPDDARVGLLALHFDGSGDHELAWRFNRIAGERARDHYAS
ncbi:MAG: adenylate/guanylate cyclase domain-containing protein, partial [Ilumatobacteraceae bacterium]